ncbi:hypothetical protein PCASD_08941 [Puccinia coronata f. sp. avenae]|uniref:Uncharacterized protein n=1 Tax=Puccinia coronata f. sp. avenae TaxID=200324 RepID=A0A2N5UMU7_9BASI|nr:hypothetical protein PCASD_08941 [Puccinia coronata f. sp. avenae]
MIRPNNVTPNYRNTGFVIPLRKQLSRAGLTSATTCERSLTSSMNSQIGAICNQSRMSSHSQANIASLPSLREDNDVAGTDLSTSASKFLPINMLDFGNYPKLYDDQDLGSPGVPQGTAIRHPNVNPVPLAGSQEAHVSTSRNKATESLPLDIKVTDHIHGLLGITQENRSLVDSLVHVPVDQRYYVQVAMYVSIQQMLAPHLAGQSARDHVYGLVIWTRSRHQIREILMDAQHKAYTQTQDPDRRPYNYTPLTCMRQQFKTKHLPPKFHEGDSKAIESVVGFIRNLLKQEQALLRTLLLTNIKRDGGRQAHHFLNRLPGNSASQWELIDDQLSQIRTWTGHRKQAFAAMLKRQDRELFTGKVMIEDINPQMV